ENLSADRVAMGPGRSQVAAWVLMKLATLRRRPDGLPGVSGVARLDRRTSRLAGRLNPGDIAIIDHVDLDRVSAEALIAARPAAVINAQPSISGRYPNLGPDVIARAGILLLDNVGSEVFGSVKEGTKIRLAGDTVYVGESAVSQGTLQTVDTVADLMAEAKAGLATQLEAFAVDTAQYMSRERELLLDGVGVPEIRTKIAGRHAVVVVRGYDHDKDLKALKHYVREYKPVLIGVDGGADALLEAGLTPHMIVGDMDAVSDAALATGAEVVVHVYPDGRAPGMARVQDLGIETVAFPSSATNEDLALLLADDKGAELIVTVGTHATLTEFLDKGRAGMASTFLTRLRIGGKLVDSRGVIRLYRNRISAAALLLLVIAALVAVVAALAASDTGRDYLSDVGHTIEHAVDWVQDLFS
ncbi:MAG TPA: putative cytokinetic ring protein SteA, partial [Jatrophihabitantaceae bacterium]